MVVNHVISQIEEIKKTSIESGETKTPIKPLASILPYAFMKAEGGDTSLLDGVLLAARRFPRGSKWIRDYIGPIISETLSKSSSTKRKQIIVCALPYLEDAWFDIEEKKGFVDRWLSAARLKYSPEIGRSVVEVLLRMASVRQWQPHITQEAWTWLKRRPQLPPVCRGRSSCCTSAAAVSAVRSLNSPELLKEYLVTVWSEWDWPIPWVRDYMHTTVTESFGGEEMKGHREELCNRLRTIRDRFELGLDHLQKEGLEMSADEFQSTKEAYKELLGTLEEMG